MRRLFFRRIVTGLERHHVAVTRLRPGERSEAHRQDFTEIFLVEEGLGTHHFNGRTFALVPGSFAIVRSTDWHWYTASKASPLVFINLAFEEPVWEALRALAHLPEEGKSKNVREEPYRNLVLNRISARMCSETMHRLLGRHDCEPLEIAAVLIALLRQAVARSDGQAVHDVPLWLERWHQGFRDIELLRNPIKQWQKASGVSPAHLARSCRKYYGASPTELLNRARIDWVQRRLSSGAPKGIDLALDAGFENLGFFYRCFRRYSGCTPREWAERHHSRVLVP